MSLFEPLWQPVAETASTAADVDDTPVNGATDAPISSNWAFDHTAAALPHSITGAVEIADALADGDEVPVYDLSATANKKSLLSRFWTYISSKLSSYTGALTGSSLTVSGDDEPTYGAELLTSAGWTVTTGWAESPDDTFAHSSGTDTLTHSATIANATKYQLAYTIIGRTAGTITITVGGASTGAVSATGAFGPTTSSTAAFTVTPTTDFNGTCVFSLKTITGVSTPRLVVKNAGSVTILEARGKDAINTFVGVEAGRYCTTGSYNVGMGYQAQGSLTTGISNFGMGYQAQLSLTTGSYNVGFGTNAQLGLTTGIYNVGFGTNAQLSLTTGSYNVGFGTNAQLSLTTGTSNVGFGTNTQLNLTTGTSNVGFGYQAQYNLTTGTNNVGVGYQAQYSLTTGSYNVGFGYQAGRYHADGATALTDPEYSVYIGTNACGKDNSDNNSVVIGGNTPIGLGANTTVIGTSATTLTRLYGDIATGVDAPSAAVHAIKTTEQLRLGYDASNYLAATVSSTGNLTLDTTGGTIYTPDTIENTVNGGGIILKSPDGTRYRITVANGGALSVSAA